MEKYKNMINEAIQMLDWTFIIKAYEMLNLEYSYDSKFNSNNTYVLKLKNKTPKKKKVDIKTKPKIADLKEELINVVNFAIEQDMNTFSYGHWLINWVNDESSELGAELQILFTPTTSISFENEPYLEMPTKVDNMDAMEINVLEDLLKKAEANEEYELAQAIFNSIKRIKRKIQ